ncbi:MAG TPA: DUF1491 family protein [Sphingomicrobium sp.]|nr:DUF1491 family protein [Sphingomicrobium sp.]
MSDARLPAHLEASSLLRRAESSGGFGTVLAKGDRDRGALILFIAESGAHFACLERALDSSGDYRWRRVGPASGAPAAEVSEWRTKRRSFDADSWLIELDIPQPERFIAETISIG